MKVKEKTVSIPPGKQKIVQAMRRLLEERAFETITIAEIAVEAGVTEGLLYKYFRDKRDLLHHVLEKYYQTFIVQIKRDLRGVDGALNRLRKIVWASIELFADHKVLARIIILETRNSAKYFETEAYSLMRQFVGIVDDVIREGIAAGEIRAGLPTASIRNAIFGAIEHSCLRRIIFNEAVSTDETARFITDLIFNGIAVQKTKGETK
ncbi:MAG TPA: TetR/AcrR family transcriptional regulator [Desulfobulbaceae bacterium]|nr:TetR/AcrR family transcriptional regulator [Desulfobulbaceae bacterium]